MSQLPQFATWKLRAIVFLTAGLTAYAVVSIGLRRALSDDNVNSGSVTIQDFESRISDYDKLHKAAAGELPSMKKPTDSTEQMERHEHRLRRAILARRAGQGQGNIFTPQIGAEFRRLIKLAFGADSKQILQSLRRSEPGTRALRVRVNHEYPDHAPLQTMPASLLANLPPLPPDLEYRLVGRTLVLRDVEANLIVDLLPEAIPSET